MAINPVSVPFSLRFSSTLFFQKDRGRRGTNEPAMTKGEKAIHALKA
jgi:hypothetical protein